MINRELKSKLIKGLDVSGAAISKKASAIRDKLLMPTDVSYYILAHSIGIKIKKYLNDEKFQETMKYQNKWATMNGNMAKTGKKLAKKSNKRNSVKEHIIKIDSSIISKEPLLSATQISESAKMLTTFATLYLLENSIRKFLEIALEKKYGYDWWNKLPKLDDLKRNVEDRKKNEDKNPWHQKRAKSEIGYLDLKELNKLVKKVDDKLVKDGILPKRGWLENMIEEVYHSRCVICHMNPLNSENIKLVDVQYTKWCRQINAKKKLL
ncbi:MAG: Swt1 family HEPN domain-containing protein [candidate division Zixibacteria bacterium]